MGGKSIAGAALGIALGVAAVCTGGWALPYPYSAIGPTIPHLLRSELVEEIAARQRPRCLVVAGNSRSAFGVNAAGLSNPQCPAANIGFPGLGAYEVYELIDQERQIGKIASLVLIVGDDYLMQHGLLPTRRDAPMDPTLLVTNPREGFVKVDFVRQAWIQVYRFQTFLEAAYGKQLTTNVFRWDQRLRRWIWPAMQDQQLDKLDGRDRLLGCSRVLRQGRRLA